MTESIYITPIKEFCMILALYLKLWSLC